MSAPDFSPLFTPRAIAVVGATETPGAVGCEVIQNLTHHGYDGRILPVNPKYQNLHGMPCFGAIEDLPETPDLVAVAVPAAAVPGVIRKAGQRGIPFAIIYASGFAEAGGEGADLQESLRRAAEESGIRIIGPNCQGMMNIAGDVRVGFGPPYRLGYRKGPVSVVSQSGAFGNSLLIGLDAEGLGLCRYSSTGNEVNTGLTDLIEGLLEDPQTSVIAGYVEGLSDGIALRRLALRAVEKKKPLVLWKVGTSRIGAQAAASHTASLAGDPACYQAVFDQLGIIRATDVGDMADLVRGLQHGRFAKGPRLGVVTVSGGAGVAMADRAEDLGLSLDPFRDETLATLKDCLPAFASFANPLDLTAGALTSPDNLARALRSVIADPNVDMLALGLAAASGNAALVAAQTLAEIAAETRMPIAIAWNAPRAQNEEAHAILERAGLPVFATPGRAVRGLSAAYRFGAALKSRPALERLAGISRRASGGTELQDEMASKAHLQGGAITVPSETRVHSADEAAAAARSIGTPVVMKLLSAAVAHKSELGGVRVGLADEPDIRLAFTEIDAIAQGLSPKGGVLVQQMVRGGTEAILGARIDDTFGPMVMFGAGGIYTELMQDVSFRLAPFDQAEARAMIAGTRFARVLAGARGRPPADLDALATALADLSERIATDGPLQEIEINPLFVLPRGQGVMTGDCVAHIATAKPETPAAAAPMAAPAST